MHMIIIHVRIKYILQPGVAALCTKVRVAALCTRVSVAALCTRVSAAGNTIRPTENTQACVGQLAKDTHIHKTHANFSPILGRNLECFLIIAGATGRKGGGGTLSSYPPWLSVPLTVLRHRDDELQTELLPRVINLIGRHNLENHTYHLKKPHPSKQHIMCLLPTRVHNGY